MLFLINASNLKQGGGIQVTLSICGQLNRFQNHRFIVVLSKYIDDYEIAYGENVKVVRYNIKNTLLSIAFGRDKCLDSLVAENNVDAVLTVFGPSRWRPRVPHLCGFARAQLVLTDSPYYQRLTLKESIIYKIWTWLFKKSSDTFYTENAYISAMLPKLIGDSTKVYTVTNYYNQVFDHPEQWKKTKELPPFDGTTCLSVSSHYLHKNFEILVGVSRYLQREYPDFKCRFVLTFNSDEMPAPEDVKDSFLFIGKVDVSECPYLYKQSDIMFMPTLMECFTATYPEAMRMGVPIVTTDLEFARGLCGNAACYYSAIDAKDAAESIYKVATEKGYATQLIGNGRKQLMTYDNYVQRADKLVDILEIIANNE